MGTLCFRLLLKDENMLNIHENIWDDDDGRPFTATYVG